MSKQLSPHFLLSEFACPCCGQTRQSAAQQLADALEPVRAEYGPLRILSGYRCRKHNDKVKGQTYSQHMLGLAVDIAADNDSDRFALVLALLRHGFKRLGIAKTLVHADIGTPTNPVIWTYCT